MLYGVLEALAEAIEELEIPLGGDALGDVLAQSDRLEAKVSEAVGVFDASEALAPTGR